MKLLWCANCQTERNAIRKMGVYVCESCRHVFKHDIYESEDIISKERVLKIIEKRLDRINNMMCSEFVHVRDELLVLKGLIKHDKEE